MGPLRQAKHERMRELVGKWQASGETAAAFARRHGMSDNVVHAQTASSILRSVQRYCLS